MYALKCQKLKSLSECPPSSHPVVLLMCGSFNPIHTAHFALFDAGKRKLESNNFTVLGGFFSPVSDAYGKPGLASFSDRSGIVQKAVAVNPYLEVDEWEGLQDTYTRTYVVLQHLQQELRHFYIQNEPESIKKLDLEGICVDAVLCCGEDLFASFFIPKVWPLNWLQKLVDEFKIVVVKRILGGAATEQEWREQMTNCTLMEEIDGAVYHLTFDRAENYFAAFDSPNNTSSSQIRNLVANALQGSLDAQKELEECAVSGTLEDIIRVYKV